MKRFDDEDLVAHYLHELAPRKASALERALQTDPALAARYEEYVTMLRGYKAGAATMVFDEAVMARNWKALQPAIAASGVRVGRPWRWRYPALAGAGLALAATAFFFATRPHDGGRLAQTSPLHEAGGAVLSTPQPESAAVSGSSMGAPSGALVMAERRYAQERGRPGRPLAHLSGEIQQGPLSSTPRAPWSRTTAALPLNTAYATVPHFIPLASVSLPALPTPQAYPEVFGPTGTAQTSATRGRSKSGHARAGVHHEFPTDLTFAMGGTLIGTREVSGPGTTSYSVGATHAVSAVGAFHQQFRPAAGYRVAVSYTRPDFQYEHKLTAASSLGRDINGRVYELAATYVVQGPHRGPLSTSAEAGGGLMAFLPTAPEADTSYNLRGAAVVGIAAEYMLSKHLGIHAGYRAQIYKSPDFRYSGPDQSVVSTTIVSNEPMVGITYRFHSK